MEEIPKPNFFQRPAFKVSPEAERRHKNSGLNGSPLSWGTDPEFLPEKLVRRLHLILLDSDMDRNKRDRMLAFTNEYAQRPEVDDAAAGPQKDQIKDTSRKARKLLESVAELSAAAVATIELHAREAATLGGSRLDVDMSDAIRTLSHGEFLAQAWDWIAAVEAVTDYAASQIKTYRQDKPTEAQRRALVANLAARHYQLNGSLPPSDDDAWFARYVREIGEYMGLHDDRALGEEKDGRPFIGERLIKSGIALVSSPSS